MSSSASAEAAQNVGGDSDTSASASDAASSAYPMRRDARRARDRAAPIDRDFEDWAKADGAESWRAAWGSRVRQWPDERAVTQDEQDCGRGWTVEVWCVLLDAAGLL
jgi:hypothetical protein